MNYSCIEVISVETSQAGPGNLEVTVNGGRVPTSAQAQGPHTYAISFTPRQPTIHTVHLRFNNHDVPGRVKTKHCLNIYIKYSMYYYYFKGRYYFVFAVFVENLNVLL